MPLSTIFLVFSRLALVGFGGVMPFAYRALVEQHKWLTAEEFAKYLATSQMLPGPTICNVALMVGNRYAGTSGALAALAGMIAGPFMVVIALGVVYQRFGEIDMFRHAIRGMAAVAAGLILATAVKMAKSMFAKADWRANRARLQVALLALAFIGLGLLQWQLALVFCVLAPLGTAATYLLGEAK
ncbi:chromate transporter [Duganella sp. BJB488]|uniref:chromate transporter n=1 Tax=unclassified Duganella TaxID=2636909 RepID=UPI000E350F98|nr:MULTISPECIES: chromate transporter [unclassified Duganella]RFP17035.1 chromate transporter [Duganella sp. BJB489]RFP20955.1 chromate transporter [Duganella sp. BJB488]RFP32396.1 chromate transporter [Duganella sp. BJB480]